MIGVIRRFFRRRERVSISPEGEAGLARLRECVLSAGLSIQEFTDNAVRAFGFSRPRPYLTERDIRDFTAAVDADTRMRIRENLRSRGLIMRERLGALDADRLSRCDKKIGLGARCEARREDVIHTHPGRVLDGHAFMPPETPRDPDV